MGALDGQTIGVIGLGLMGKPMARHLAAAGAAVIVHNRSRAAVDELAGDGIEPAESARQLASRSPVVILVLPDTRTVQQVLFEREGVAEGLADGGLVIDMGTTGVSQTRQFAKWIAESGGEFVDAPVSGGQLGAIEANLTIMAGGTDAAIARAKPILDVLGQRFTHVGDVGAGQVAKAANQVIVGLTIGAVAEALALARRSGVDPGRVREALAGGFAASRILELHGKRMADGDFEPGGRAAIQRKDMAQALALAAECDIDLPATQLNLELYDRLIKQGGGDLDHSALYTLYKK